MATITISFQNVTINVECSDKELVSYYDIKNRISELEALSSDYNSDEYYNLEKEMRKTCEYYMDMDSCDRELSFRDWYNLYEIISCIDHEAYVRYAQADFDKFVSSVFENGVFVGSEDDFSTYSDWYKDIYGFRPRGVKRA